MNYLNETGLKKLFTIIKTAINDKANVNHSHINYVTRDEFSLHNGDADALQGHVAADFVAKSGDTMEDIIIAQTNTNYTTAQIRNVIISPAEPSGGNNGDIWLQY